MIQLPYLEVFKVSGQDAGEFLHGQFTADTGSLAAGESRFSAYCSPKGQVIALLLVCRHESDWLIVMDGQLGAGVIRRLKQYVMRAKVNFSLLSDFQVSGISEPASQVSDDITLNPAETNLHYALGSNPQQAQPDQAQPEQLFAWRKQEILTGVCWLEPITSERFIPQMLNLEEIGALSFSKGCYPGQEIVARTHYLGKLKRRSIILECEQSLDISPGDEIQIMVGDEPRKGIVIQAINDAARGTMLQAVAPIDYLEKIQRWATT